MLEKLNMVDDPGYYNTWARMADKELIPTDWLKDAAAAKGHASVQAALAEEHGAMYEALMAAYGKNEA